MTHDLQGLRQDELCVRQGRNVQLRQQLRLRAAEGIGGRNEPARPRRIRPPRSRFEDYSTAKLCNATGVGMHDGGGNVNDPTRILQPTALVVGMYWLTYQNVQSSAGSKFNDV